MGKGVLIIYSVLSRHLLGNSLPSELVVIFSPPLVTLNQNSLGNSRLSLLMDSTAVWILEVEGWWDWGHRGVLQSILFIRFYCRLSIMPVIIEFSFVV